ncbi:hypothetical protein H0E87_019603 [Populus deltoides]|uniref:EIF3F/CSN6-like C-terminal domain-containing protein n=1 Tax=Populus deltoides TaxID=3696 RepID=A0A8T2XVS4_POPDE|nr:hypothetical protein H0E87_019603 [Populus deltoides]
MGYGQRFFNKIVLNLQSPDPPDVFNLLPNLNVADLIKAFAVKTNDMMLVIYLSSLVRSVVALHNLINNKMLNKEHEKAEDSKLVSVPPAVARDGGVVRGSTGKHCSKLFFLFFSRVPRRSCTLICIAILQEGVGIMPSNAKFDHTTGPGSQGVLLVKNARTWHHIDGGTNA